MPVITCPVCEQALPEGARFCPNCGALVATLIGTEERKFVTVLFADLVDSTGLAQRLDPERARDLQGRFFEAVTEELQALRGKPEKFIGDAVMAVFGLPHVHEDDALRAVRSGLAIRGRTRRLGRDAGLAEPLEVRIGIETGEAATGFGPAGQMLVTGTVVNAASRLQSGARPDEVLAGQTTRALTTTAVSYGRRRNVRARGFDEPLLAFPVQSLSNRSARRTIPFVGRAGEQAILGDTLGMASSTGRPVLVSVIGESGIGKSRLADELAAGVSAAVTVLRGRGRSYSDTATFGPVAAIVGDLAGIDGQEPPEEIRRRLRELADRCCRPDEAARVAERLANVFGLAERPEESAFVHDVQSGFLALIDGLAKDQPVLLIFEDVHTFGAPMLDLVERLGTKSRRGTRRALVVALARSELLEMRPGWGSGGCDAVLLRLEPLNLEESIRSCARPGAGRSATRRRQPLPRGPVATPTSSSRQPACCSPATAPTPDARHFHRPSRRSSPRGSTRCRRGSATSPDMRRSSATGSTSRTWRMSIPVTPRRSCSSLRRRRSWSTKRRAGELPSGGSATRRCATWPTRAFPSGRGCASTPSSRRVSSNPVTCPGGQTISSWQPSPRSTSTPMTAPHRSGRPTLSWWPAIGPAGGPRAAPRSTTTSARWPWPAPQLGGA